MKLNAIRLREVGRFTAPVAFEGLSGGLDVLAGPNEFGKSTLLQAVRTALFTPHTSSAKQTLEPLRPYAGGAPRVEIDFETGGERWRVCKQFLAGRSAELKNLGSGAVWRAADAEAMLGKLLSQPSFALLCVEQGAAADKLAGANAGGPALKAALEREVESVADGNALRRIAGRAKGTLAGLVTSHNPPRPAGDHKAALEKREALQRELEAAERRRDAARQRLDALDEIRARLAQLADADARAQRVAAQSAAQEALATADAARRQSARAEEVVAAGEERLAHARAMLETFDQRAEELALAERGAAEGAARLGALESEVAAAAATYTQCRDAHEALRRELAAAERRERALQAAGRLQAVAQTLQAAEAASAQGRQLRAQLAECHADTPSIVAARREAAAVAGLEARLSAAAPRVSFTAVPGASGKVLIDGRALADGEVFNPTHPITLDIEGIGSILIAPGHSADVVKDEEALAAHRGRLQELLQRMHAPSLADAEAALTVRQELEGQLAAAVARLQAAAPEGMSRLIEAHAALQAEAAAFGATAGSAADASGQSETLRAALDEAELRLGGAERTARSVREQAIALGERVSGYRDRAQKLAAELGAPEVRAARREGLRQSLEVAQLNLNDAVLERAAWRDRLPDAAEYATLGQRATAAVQDTLRAEEELAQLAKAEARLEGELQSDCADDVEARVAELRDMLAAATARCDDLQQETAALQLLLRELEAASARTRERYARPVLARLEPYLELVLPRARLLLGDDLAPQALQRASLAESFERLSGGTREQLALLTRLAFARLLADGATPAPLILDDALVHTDDERLLGIFKALQLAARSHQVLVLTCRERLFADLGGNRISPSVWEDARAAA